MSCSRVRPRGEMLSTFLSQHPVTAFPCASFCTPQITSSENSLGGFASCDLVAGENIDVESSGDRWALNKVRNELVYPRIFFVCVALGILLTFPKAQGKNLVGLAIRYKEDLVHEPRLVFKDWEDLIVNGFGELSCLSWFGPDGNDSGEHSVPPFGFVGSIRHKPKLGGVERQLPKIVQGQVGSNLPNAVFLEHQRWRFGLGCRG